MPPTVRAIRGATTVDVDTAEEVSARVQELLTALLERNALSEVDLISVIFTATDDIVSAFPATAAREMGLKDAPLLCARELAVTGAQPRCIRVLVHANINQDSVEHVYLREAEGLRDDPAG